MTADVYVTALLEDVPSPHAREALAAVPPLLSLRAVAAGARYLEAVTLRAALEATGWLPARAARRLGCARKSSLQRALQRHPELLAEIERRRGSGA